MNRRSFTTLLLLAPSFASANLFKVTKAVIKVLFRSSGKVVNKGSKFAKQHPELAGLISIDLVLLAEKFGVFDIWDNQKPNKIDINVKNITNNVIHSGLIYLEVLDVPTGKIESTGPIAQYDQLEPGIPFEIPLELHSLPYEGVKQISISSLENAFEKWTSPNILIANIT